jgi:hypothetical protein
MTRKKNKKKKKKKKKKDLPNNDCLVNGFARWKQMMLNR